MSRVIRAHPAATEDVAIRDATGTTRSPAVPMRRRPWSLTGLSLGIYLLSRLGILVVAVCAAALWHRHLGTELSNWDGVWYLRLVVHGYPTRVGHGQSTLGFLPLYPMIVWVVAHVARLGALPAALVVSGLFGALDTVLVGKLCSRWWGEAAARRAVVLWCVFPGSVVCSMVYPEAITVAAIAGCLLALESRRWLLAGLLASLATAVEPIALAVVGVCIVACVVELRRGRRLPGRDWKTLLSPLFAPMGIGAFAVFLWVWTGTPFATLKAQADGWHQQGNPVAVVVHAVEHLTSRHGLASLGGADLNTVVGVVGAAVLVAGIVALVRQGPRRPPAPAMALVGGVAALTVISLLTPPNARMLVVAFPVVVVWADRLGRRSYHRLVAGSIILLVVMSGLTFVGHLLSP